MITIFDLLVGGVSASEVRAWSPAAQDIMPPRHGYSQRLAAEAGCSSTSCFGWMQLIILSCPSPHSPLSYLQSKPPGSCQ